MQLDVPEGVRNLQFTMDAPGNVAELMVWRGSIGSSERWIASHRFNPPVRLTINNPGSGRYYLRVMDHGSLPQSQVRPYTLVLSGAQASLTAAATPSMASVGSADPITFTIQFSGSRSQIRSRIDPFTIGVVTIVSGVTIIGSWVGHNIVSSQCERNIKARLKEELLTHDGFPLDDEEAAQLYRAYRQSTSFAAEWLAQTAAEATEQAIKDFVVAKYGGKFAKAAEIAYKVAKGEHPAEMLLNEIAGQLAPPGLDWALLPATTALKVFLAEGQSCIKTSKQLRELAKRLTKRNQDRRYRVTSSWDPNAKSATFGVDGFIPDEQVIDYTIYFENLSTATASTEEVLIEDVLDENLDESTLQLTGFGFGSHEVILSTPTDRLSQGVDLGNNLVVRVDTVGGARFLRQGDADLRLGCQRAASYEPMVGRQGDGQAPLPTHDGGVSVHACTR